MCGVLPNSSKNFSQRQWLEKAHLLRQLASASLRRTRECDSVATRLVSLHVNFLKPLLKGAHQLLVAAIAALSLQPGAIAQQFERQTEIEQKATEQKKIQKKKPPEKETPQTKTLKEWGFKNAASSEPEGEVDGSNWFWVGLGGFSLHPLKVSGSANGSASFLGRIYETLHASANFDLSDRLVLVPKVLFSPIGRAFADGGGRSRIFSVYGMLHYKWEKFRAGGGLGVFLQWLNGSGGTVTIQDGTGSETGYLPNRSVWTSQTPIVLNFTYFLRERFELFGEFVTTGVFSSKIAINFHLGVSYGVF